MFHRTVDKYYLEHKLDMDKEHEDLCSREYCGLSAPVFKLGLRSKLLSEETKIHMLRNWVASNYFLMHQAAVRLRDAPVPRLCLRSLSAPSLW